MASSGSMILATPSPLPSTPAVSQVEGRNCIGPSAPAVDGPMFSPWFDSTCPTAANTYQSSPNPYFRADVLYSILYCVLEIGPTGLATICWRAIPNS